MKHRSVVPLLLSLLAVSAGCGTTRQTISAARITGTWVKPVSYKPSGGKAEKEGFTLKTDGTIAFVNIHSMTGDTWKLNNDTLTYSSHTERYPAPQPARYVVVKLTGSQLELRPVKSAHGYSDIYKREK